MYYEQGEEAVCYKGRPEACRVEPQRPYPCAVGHDIYGEEYGIGNDDCDKYFPMPADFSPNGESFPEFSSPVAIWSRGCLMKATGTSESVFSPMMPSDRKSTASPVMNAITMLNAVFIFCGSASTIAGSMVTYMKGLILQ